MYVPLVFGFVTYSRDDRVQHPCRFLDLASAGAGPVGGILGGPRSLRHERTEEAAAFAAFASGAEAQRSLVGPAGGQPGSRSAWHAPELDEARERLLGAVGDDRAGWVRPRGPLVARLSAREGDRLLNRSLAEAASRRACLDGSGALYLDCRGQVAWVDRRLPG